MYKATGDMEHWRRAQLFASFALREDLSPTLWNEPDEPYCLANGLAGLACFLLDLCHPEQAAFPGLDVWTNRLP